jgi:hypothetical protein
MADTELLGHLFELLFYLAFVKENIKVLVQHSGVKVLCAILEIEEYQQDGPLMLKAVGMLENVICADEEFAAIVAERGGKALLEKLWALYQGSEELVNATSSSLQSLETMLAIKEKQVICLIKIYIKNFLRLKFIYTLSIIKRNMLWGSTKLLGLCRSEQPPTRCLLNSLAHIGRCQGGQGSSRSGGSGRSGGSTGVRAAAAAEGPARPERAGGGPFGEAPAAALQRREGAGVVERGGVARRRVGRGLGRARAQGRELERGHADTPPKPRQVPRGPRRGALEEVRVRRPVVQRAAGAVPEAFGALEAHRAAEGGGLAQFRVQGGVLRVEGGSLSPRRDLEALASPAQGPLRSRSFADAREGSAEKGAERNASALARFWPRAGCVISFLLACYRSPRSALGPIWSPFLFTGNAKIKTEVEVELEASLEVFILGILV